MSKPIRKYARIVDNYIPMAYSVNISDNIRLRTFKDDPEMRRELQKAITIVLWEARNKASNDVYEYMQTNEHNTFTAVHHSVYNKIFGGNMNFLTQRRALRMGHVSPSRRGRSQKTERMLSYLGTDRGMILRWLNKGTKNRWTVRMDGHPMYRNSVAERPKNRSYVFPGKLGGRGGAAKRRTTTINMFDKAVEPRMEQASVKLQLLIDEIINEMF